MVHQMGGSLDHTARITRRTYSPTFAGERDQEVVATTGTPGSSESVSENAAAVADYEESRDEMVKGLLDVTDAISSFEWDLEEVKGLHLVFSKEMNAEVDVMRGLDQEFVAPAAAAPAAS